MVLGDIPHANPSTYKLTPRIITSRLIPNSLAVTVVAVENTLLENETQNVIAANDIVMIHFFDRGKFIGLAGSSSPSQPTTWVMGSAQARTCCTRDNTFSVVIAFSRSRSRSSLLQCIDGACEGAAVLTAVSGGESHVASFFGSEVLWSFEISGSSKTTISSKNKRDRETGDKNY
jgi:hypothetical protein